MDFKRSRSWLVNWEIALDVLRPQIFGRTGNIACLACQCKCSFGSLSCSNTTVKDVCECVPPNEWHRALVSQRQVTTETCSFRTAIWDVCHQTFGISKHRGCLFSSPPLMSHWKHWPVVFLNTNYKQCFSWTIVRRFISLAFSKNDPISFKSSWWIFASFLQW